MTISFLIFLDQVCQKWIKIDQTWSNWISQKSKNVAINSFHIPKWTKLFGQQWLFGSNGLDNGFSAETAFRPKILLSNLKRLFGQKWFFGLKWLCFKWICLISQSIESFGSLLMAESFQACFYTPVSKKNLLQLSNLFVRWSCVKDWKRSKSIFFSIHTYVVYFPILDTIPAGR